MIQVDAGTYAANNNLRNYVGRRNVTIQGDPTTPANVIVSITTSSCFLADRQNGGCKWSILGFKLTTSGSAFSCLTAQAGHIEFSNIEFGSSTVYHIATLEKGVIIAVGNYTISGGATAHVGSDLTGFVAIDGRAVTVIGTPGFPNGFVVAFRCGVISAPSMTFSGAATGRRYWVLQNGVVNTNGGGANYFPGNTAGVSGTGGQYI